MERCIEVYSHVVKQSLSESLYERNATHQAPSLMQLEEWSRHPRTSPARSVLSIDGNIP